MIIGLMGFEFSSPNKGCEALSYSFVSMLEKYFKNRTDVVLYNYTMFDFGFLPEMFPNFGYEKRIFKLKDPKFAYIRSLMSCDLIFDVTMGDSFSDIYSLQYYNYLAKEKAFASFFNRRYVLLPQTYGPFYHVEASRKANKIFRRAYKIFCRDELSKNFLRSEFGISKAIVSSDMAFALTWDKNKYSFSENQKTKIGINVSGLLYKGGFTTNNQFQLRLDYSDYITKLITYFTAQNDQYEVHLIPHVIDLKEEAPDDDYKVSVKLHHLFPQVKLAPIFETPIDAKSYISNMDVFIGARMHSTIAAFSSGVVTIPVSYSRKFEGLYENLGYKYLINAKEETTESALTLTKAYVDNRIELQQTQENAMKTIESLIAQFEEDLFELLNESDRPGH